jgi:trehalose/maltose transport system substrate-binding protein
MSSAPRSWEGQVRNSDVWGKPGPYRLRYYVRCSCNSRSNHLRAREIRFLSQLARLVLAAISRLVLAAALACDPGAHHAPPITIRLLDEEDLSKESGRLLREQIDQFTQKTGIQVETVRSVGDIRSELEIRRTLLETGPAGADVYGLISQWPPLFADDLIDLKSYVPAPEIAAHFPEIIQNYTVNGRLVAMPSAFDVEMLFYRGDLLRLYGYPRPPETWEQLEKMAARIEAGERAKGRKNFWGFLFAGARGEALTDCALEWQVPDGGGTILDNSQVTVNNEQAIRSWERAARWIGSISPPGVVVYSEWDSLNLWLEGRAAFMRGYSVQFMIRAQRSLSRVSLEIAPCLEAAHDQSLCFTDMLTAFPGVRRTHMRL